MSLVTHERMSAAAAGAAHTVDVAGFFLGFASPAFAFLLAIVGCFGLASDLHSSIYPKRDRVPVAEEHQIDRERREPQSAELTEECKDQLDQQRLADAERFSGLERKLQDLETDLLCEGSAADLKEHGEKVLAQQKKDGFEWLIPNPLAMKAEHPNVGDRFSSILFFVRGLGPWTVDIFPSGHADAPGGVGAFLHGFEDTVSVNFQCRLTINGKSIELTEEQFFGRRDTWGCEKFPGLAWPTTNDEPVCVEVEFLQMTDVTTTSAPLPQSSSSSST